MTTRTQSTTSPPDAPPPDTTAASRSTLRSRIGRLLTRGGRIALVAVVVVVSGWTVVELTEALRGTTPPVEPSPTVEERLASTADFESVASLAAGGRWEFSEGSSTIAIGTLPTEQLAAYWNAPPPQFTDAGGAWQQSVLDLVRAMKLVPSESGDAKTYRFESPIMRAEVRTTGSGDAERVVMARAAALSEIAGQWQTLEVAPRAEQATAGDRSPLIPYPPSTTLLATRHDFKNGVGAEFSRVPLPLSDLLDYWRQVGTPAVFADFAADTPTREGFSVYNGRTIRLILWQPPNVRATTVLAIALDSGPKAEAKPVDVR